MVAKLPRRPGGMYDLSVRGAIAFNATRENVWLCVLSRIEIGHGMVRLQRHAQLADAYCTGNDVVASIVVEASTPDGRQKDARPEEFVPWVHLPATAIGLISYAGEETEDGPVVESSSTAESVWWQLPNRKSKNMTMTLHSQPTLQSPALVIWNVVQDPNNSILGVREVDRIGNWLKVSRERPFTSITGWIPVSELVPGVEDRGQGCGCLEGPYYMRIRTSPENSKYHGPARVILGTTVYNEPGAGAWGTVNSDAEFKVAYSGGDWVVLEEIPGIYGPGLHAWVPASAVRFPQMPTKPQ